MGFNKKISEKIKQRRLELGLSKSDLGKKAGLTSAFIGQIERDKSGFSLDTLYRIAEALDISVLEIIMEGEAHQTWHNPVVRAQQRASLTLPGSGVEVELLTPDVNPKMTAHFACVTPKSGNFYKKFNIKTEEFIFVLSGELIITLNDEHFVLKDGDSIYFKGEDLNALNCGNVEETHFICVITPLSS